MGSLAEGVRSSAIPAKQSRLRRVSKQSGLSGECVRATFGQKNGARTVQADAKRHCSLSAARAASRHLNELKPSFDLSDGEARTSFQARLRIVRSVVQ